MKSPLRIAALALTLTAAGAAPSPANAVSTTTPATITPANSNAVTSIDFEPVKFSFDAQSDAQWNGHPDALSGASQDKTDDKIATRYYLRKRTKQFFKRARTRHA